jgi:hypothetical protein
MILGRILLNLPKLVIGETFRFKAQQARVLRCFLKRIGIKDVKFHALRACFATQLLAKNIPPAVLTILPFR